MAFSYIRRDDGASAEPLYRKVIALFTLAVGPESPDVLRVRICLAQSFFVQAQERRGHPT